MRKIDLARNLYIQKMAEAEAKGRHLSRKDIIAIFVHELGMTEASASTFHYNVTKALKEDAGAVTFTSTSSEEPVVQTKKGSPFSVGTVLKRNQRVRDVNGVALSVSDAGGEYVWVDGQAGWYHITTLYPY